MTDHARPTPIERTVASPGGWSALNVLLGLFAACLAGATLIALGLGFDLFVPPPDIAGTLDFPADSRQFDRSMRRRGHSMPPRRCSTLWASRPWHWRRSRSLPLPGAIGTLVS